MAERGRWLAWDAHFLGGTLGQPMRDRFGIAGIVVFVGFLSACKRNSPQGQMTYGNEQDALGQMGLAGLILTNEKGEEWTLDEFWTFLGRFKVTSCRRRAHLKQITSTRWAKWQKDFDRQNDAERKRTSRATKPRTQPGRTSDESVTETRGDETSQSAHANGSGQLHIVGSETTIDEDDEYPPHPLADRWHQVLQRHGAKTTERDARAVIARLLPMADADTIDERIGFIDDSAGKLSSATYLSKTVMNWLAAHHQPGDAS